MLEAKTISMEAILPVCVKFCASHDAKVKKSACQALISCSETFDRPDVGLLAVNILMKDLNDPNPEVRSTAIDTISSLSLLAEDHSLPAISSGLRDSNPRVRKAAVVGCGKVWRHSPSIIEDHGLVDVLYTMVRDADSHVMTFALQTLNVILQKEGGIVINSTMANYLLSRLEDCQDLEKCFVLEYLQKYRPKNVEARLHLMNHVDPFVVSQNGPVFLAASKLFHKVMVEDDETEKLIKDFTDRISVPLRNFLKDPLNVEFQVALLKFFSEILDKSDPSHFTKYYKDFRLDYQERVEISELKCDILQKLSKASSEEINEEVIKYFVYILQSQQFSPKVNSQVLKGLLFNKNQTVVNQELLKLLETSPEQIVPLVVQNARNLPNNFDAQICQKVCGNSFAFCDNSELKNILYILCHHLDIQSSPYILEKLLDTLTEDELKEQSQLLLLTGVKVFAKSPAESQHILGRIFEICAQNGMEEKVEFYGKLLTKHTDLFKKIISK